MTIGTSGDRLFRLCDWLAIALVASLPWSTSATGILAVAWLIAVIPTLRASELRDELLRPASGFPVALVGLALAGMLWAEVPLGERLDGLKSFLKLLFIPLLFIHFRRSPAAAKGVLIGFLCSCSVLLVLSWLQFFLPQLDWRGGQPGVPVKNYSSQADLFTIGVFVLAFLALEAWRASRVGMAVACALAVGALLANILYIATTRTALVVIAVLCLAFGFIRLHWKGLLGSLLLLAAIGIAIWPSASFLRARVGGFMDELQRYETENARTSAGERVEFWKKSVHFIASAPLIGHGTGSIRDQFRRSVTGEDGASAVASANPHNQTFAVGIQLGLIGIGALYAMWAVHLMLFRGEGLVAWVGLVIVVQNIVGSLFNSALFDFTQGWGYVIGIGVAGGTVLRHRSAQAKAAGRENLEDRCIDEDASARHVPVHAAPDVGETVNRRGDPR